MYNLGTDFGGNGIWVHDNDENNELTWINHKWNCGNAGRDDFYTHGGDAILFGISKGSFFNGAWCDYESYKSYRFICEGFITI